MNIFKKNIAPNTSADSENQAKRNFGNSIEKSTEFTFFITKEKIQQFLPHIIILTIILVLYIALNHYHVKSLKQKSDLKNELKELRSEYISVKSSLMKKSSQSEVAKDLEIQGLKELRTPPQIIISPAKK